MDLHPFDLRAGFDALACHVAKTLSLDPKSGALVVFANKARNRIKVLWYDRNGYIVLYKRLDKGSFPLPEVDSQATYIALSREQFAQLLAALPVPLRSRILH
jgi:transposase